MTENRCPKLGEYECGMGHGYSCGSYNTIEDI